MSKKVNFSGDLTGWLLIATPTLAKSIFEKSVVYICAHNETGAMGLLVNSVISDISSHDILEQLNIPKSQINLLPTVHLGGPIEASRGFILHTNDYINESSQLISQNIALTSDIDMLQDITKGGGPNKSLLALGYAGWSPGQLEDEIATNNWLTVPANEDIVFNTANNKKWTKSNELLGIAPYQLTDVIGNA